MSRNATGTMRASERNVKVPIKTKRKPACRALSMMITTFKLCGTHSKRSTHSDGNCVCHNARCASVQS